jgi:23S rRNA (cytidine1920-2'-O)/16S rRNA (cytidine1409-2'-O)-methyltransferase
VPRVRLDTELVRRGLATSRAQAVRLVNDERVTVDGWPARKPAMMVQQSAAVVVATAAAEEPQYASRGAHKLLGALTAFRGSGLTVAGRRCLDAGASTGGFTDVLLREGAREVVAVDVGYGQLVWRLRSDPRVTVLDRTNVRHLRPSDIGGTVDLVVADLSFISLTTVLPALVSCLRPPTSDTPVLDTPASDTPASGDPTPGSAVQSSPVGEAEALLLVKPQFEVGRERLGKGGVVRDPALRAQAVLDIARVAHTLGMGVAGVVASPLPGPAGNVEYVLWLRRSAPPVRVEDVEDAVRRGP